MAKKAQMKKKAAVKKPPVKAKKAPPAKTKPAPPKKATAAAKPAAAKPAAAAAGAPPGTHAITPHLTVRGASHAIDFYRRAFGAQELSRVPSPDSYGIGHAELQIGDSRLYLCDESPQSKSPQSLGGTPCSIHIYVTDADKVYQQAVDAGATALMPLADMFWGDRYGKVLDPFGHEWSIATHKEDVSREELEKRFKALVAKKGQGAPPA
jgi:PhnB protein